MTDIRIGTLQTRGGDGRQYTLYVYGEGGADARAAGGGTRFETRDGRLARPLPSGDLFELETRDGPLRLVADGPLKPAKG